MSIDQEPFKRYHEEKKQDSFTVKISPEYRKMLEDMKYRLQQPKDSTALKQLAELGAKVLLGENPTPKAISVIVNNIRKNKRTGIIDYD